MLAAHLSGREKHINKIPLKISGQSRAIVYVYVCFFPNHIIQNHEGALSKNDVRKNFVSQGKAVEEGRGRGWAYLKPFVGGTSPPSFLSCTATSFWGWGKGRERVCVPTTKNTLISLSFSLLGRATKHLGTPLNVRPF